MYIGEIIKKFRTNNNLSQRAFAKRTSLSPSYINTLEKIYNPKTNKPYSITTDVAIEIANAMSINVENLLNILDEKQQLNSCITNTETFKSHSVSSIPILDKVKNGYNYFLPENIIGTICSQETFNDLEDLFALRIKEDSMSPAIIKNDFVIVKKQNDFENGNLVVALIKNDNAIIRKAKKSEVGILLQPLNTNYEPLIFTYEEMKTLPVNIIGIVKRLERKFN